MVRLILRSAGIIFSLISLFFLFGPRGYAQESPPEAAPRQWGGNMELGYRFARIEGIDRYREAVNLMEGLRLFDFGLWLKDPAGKGLADSVRFRMNQIGDPFPSGRLDIKKNRAYQITADYRESRFFFNREDTGILTDNHNFDQTRRRGAVTLSLFPSEEFRFNLGYSYAGREGEARVPRIFTFVPNLKQDLNEKFNEVFVSADFPLRNWNLQIKQAYSTFENRNKIDQSPTKVENRDEEIRTYVSTLKAHNRLGSRWDLDMGYIYAHSEGEARLTTRPASQVTTGNGGFIFNTHVLELGLSHLLHKDFLLHFDYRFHTFDQDGQTNTDQFLLPQVTTKTDYRLKAHTGTLRLEYIPIPDLTMKVGYRLQYRDINAENFNQNRFDGGPASKSTDILAHGWIASTDWKPFKALSLFGEYEGTVFDNPYTRISPQEEHIAKVRVNYKTPIQALTLTGTGLWKRKTNPDQQFRLDIQDYILGANYQPAALPGLSLDASFTYESIRDKKDITNQGGIPPPPLFTTFVFDSDALIYSGGISYEGIYRGLGARFSGSFARTKNENEQEYASGTLSFWYKNKWVIPILTLERTYLFDKVQPKDSFSATLVTISLRKDF